MANNALHLSALRCDPKKQVSFVVMQNLVCDPPTYLAAMTLAMS